MWALFRQMWRPANVHLKSPDFFDVATYPKAFFRSTRIEWQPLRTFRLHGELTMKGVTHILSLYRVQLQVLCAQRHVW
jgi:polyisoprenoid-binding protein YceI